MPETVDIKIWVALIAAGASLLVAVVGYLGTRGNQKALEILRADLAEKAATRNARLEYEFEARKRLYKECGPLLFQLSEFAERALGRIGGLARTAASGDLDPGRSWLGRGYYSLSTYYRLFAPLAAGRLLQNKLTHLDLSLDPAIHWQYALVKQLADSFTDDFVLARGDVDRDGAAGASNATLRYDPHHDDAETLRRRDSATYWQQGVPRGILENAVSALIVSDADGRERVMDFREFQEAFAGGSLSVRAAFDRIGYLFDGFHPRSRPVLWRILIAQAFLYRAFLAAQPSELPAATLWSQLRQPGDLPDLDWRGPDERAEIPDAHLAREIEIGAGYAKQATAGTLSRLREKPAGAVR